MKYLVKYVLSVSLFIGLSITSMFSSVCFATEESNSNQETKTIEEIDSILRNAGTPEDKLAAMDDETKLFIYQNSGEDIEYIEVKEEPKLATYSNSQIPPEELVISVNAYKNGNNVDIYPKYQWMVPVKPRGKDYFGYYTSTSYSVVPNVRQNTIWATFPTPVRWEISSAGYAGSSLYGYEHRGVDLGSPDSPLYIKGNFYFQVNTLTSNPDKKISIAYVHDLSSSSSLSYGLSVGPFGFSVTPSSSKVRYSTNVYQLVY